MRPRWCVQRAAIAACLGLTFHVTHAAPNDPSSTDVSSDAFSPRMPEGLLEGASVIKRDGHHNHNPHASPLLELNETEVLMYHAPTPPSYYTIDWDNTDMSVSRHPGLMFAHAVFMCLAFFVALPVGIAMRSVRHGWHGVAVMFFYGLSVVGCAASALYTKLTPNMYEGSSHGSHGYLILLFALLLSGVDVIHLFRRLVAFIKGDQERSLRSFWTAVVLGKDANEYGQGPEYSGLIAEEPEEFDEVKFTAHSHHDVRHTNTAEWANNVRHHQRHSSTESEGTLFNPHLHRTDSGKDEPELAPAHKRPLLRRIGLGSFAVFERLLVFAGLLQLLTGIVIYTGGCRENYLNGCLAHLIKGAIFWSYGLLSFARFLGSFAELGWAWNRAPTEDFYTAEFVESLVIFVYGATNTWMERFGANPGDPFTTKQIQHIGIAVMFCFAGLVGMGIESKKIRQWLAASTFASLSTPNAPREAVAEPPSYSASFNPFPPLVIGITGAAMAAHAQTYLFQVQIHALWGNLLVGFSVLRCLTYFFLWLSPPRSILPSRPPTEALGSFFLACGGLVFMLSTEEVTIAAMRRGRDDVMMFLNVAVAITCFAFCWTLFIVGFKGLLKSRSRPVVGYQTSA
ncbi:cytoplasmic protein [Infundibulicybe gibba]|nr:cytoplasmic protein [Infundibulicybe gibba]